jgi:hypothetical protein
MVVSEVSKWKRFLQYSLNVALTLDLYFVNGCYNTYLSYKIYNVG